MAQIRIAETGAWIGSVHVTATQLSAEVQGTAVADAELELFGLADRSQRRLDGPGTVTYLLSEGLPDSAWLVGPKIQGQRPAWPLIKPPTCLYVAADPEGQFAPDRVGGTRTAMLNEIKAS